MKVADVSTDDCRNAARLINLLQMGDYTVTGKDMCSGADALRWLQQLATEMAKAHQAGTSAPATPVAAPPATDGALTVKSYSPGKSGKK